MPNHQVLQKQLKENSISRNKPFNKGAGAGGMNPANQTDQQIYRTMGLPQIVQSQSMYYNQDYQAQNGSPQGLRPIKSDLGVYPENNYAPQMVIQTENGDLGQEARVLMASPIPITAAGFPQNHHKIKKFSRETNYESDFSIIETEGAFPQQPSSGETMDYKYKRSQQQQQIPYPANSGVLSLPQVYNNQFQQQQMMIPHPPVLANIVNGGAPQLAPQQMVAPFSKQQMSGNLNDQNSQFAQVPRGAGGLINSRAQRAAQPLISSQLGTVTELYTDTNYSGEGETPSNHGEGQSQKDGSILKSNSFKDGPPNGQRYSSQINNANNGARQSPHQRTGKPGKNHRSQAIESNSRIADGELQIDQSLGGSPTQSQDKPFLSQDKRQALKKAMEKTGKQNQLLPLVSKTTSHNQQSVGNNQDRETTTEETKKPNSSKRSLIQQQPQNQSMNQNFHNEQMRVVKNNSERLNIQNNQQKNSLDKSSKQLSNRPQQSVQQEDQEDVRKSELIDDYDQSPKNGNKQVMGQVSQEKSLLKSAENRQSLSHNNRLSDQKRESFNNEDHSNMSPEGIKTSDDPAIEEIPNDDESQEDQELNDLIMLISTHQTLKQESETKANKRNSGNQKTKRHGVSFRKKRHDMVFRQLKYVHESALMEEVKTFEDDQEIKRDSNFLVAHHASSNNNKLQRQQTSENTNLEKIGLGTVHILKLIPRIVSENAGDKKNVHKVFIHAKGNTKVKLLALNGEKSNKCFGKRSVSFPRNKQNYGPLKYSEQSNTIMQFKFKELIDINLLETIEEKQENQIHQKRSNSYDHSLKLGKNMPSLNLKAPPTRKLEEIFPYCHQHENNINKQSNFDESSKHNALSNSNRGGGMVNADHSNHQLNIPNLQLHHTAAAGDLTLMNRYDEGLSSLQSSMEEDQDNNKLIFGGQHNHRGQNLHNLPRRQPGGMKMPQQKLSKNQLGIPYNNGQQAFNNSIFTLGDYKGITGGNLDMIYQPEMINSRIISKEKVGEVEELLSQALKSLNITPKLVVVQNKLSSAIKDQFVISVQDDDMYRQQSKDNYLNGSLSSQRAGEAGISPVIGTGEPRTSTQSIILKSTKLQRAIENIKPTLRVFLTQEQEEQMLRNVSFEDQILKFQKFFIMPKENGAQIPAVLTGVIPIQKIVDLKSSFITNSSRKIGNSSQTITGPTDQNLNDLQQAEQNVIFANSIRRYDVLIDTEIFKNSFYFLGNSVADPGQSLFASQQTPLIIKLRGTVQETDVDAVEDSSEHSTVIISFLRERYLRDFTKYQKHLTQRERPTSRYYNSHQAKELAMLSMTGGFSQEHKALPQWKVHNNQELLHFQVAQLRRAYSLWLNRVSMNECIKRTLFEGKHDLLLNNVRSSNNINLTSPQLIEVTIDRICQLCYKPEDTYKLNIILGKSAQQQNGIGGLTTLATTNAKTIGNSGLLNQSRSEDSLYESVKTSSAQGLDETQADYNDKNETATAIYLHNHPAFITYNQDLEVADNLSIDSFIPMRFRMSTLFGYKTKIVRDGLYEVFEPVADARYLLAIAFKRAFMIKREQRGKHLAHAVVASAASHRNITNVSNRLEVGQLSHRNQKELVPSKISMRKSEISTDKYGKD